MTLNIAVLGAVVVVVALIAVYAAITDVPPVPTSRRVKAAMLDLIPADFAGTVYDLGSGWGTLTVALARRWPKATVIGIERSPVPWLVSKGRLALAGLPNARVIRGDMFRRPIQDADLALCYLLSPTMARLSPKLAAELRPGAAVISNTFALPGREPATVVEVADMYRSKVYFYRF